MIKFKGQRVDNGEWVEGHYTGGMATVYRHVIISTIDNCVYQINFDTLQVMTTDGWADIADVEVVRKNPAKCWNCQQPIKYHENGQSHYKCKCGASI